MSEQKRLDRPDREKEIISILIAYRNWVLNFDKGRGEQCNLEDATTLILALIIEAKREEKERILEEFREGGKLIWAFINKEKGKGNDASLLITVRDMVHDMIEGQALKSS